MKCLSFITTLFISFAAAAQHVSGLYTGTLYNDTTRMKQNYELALSEYRGKITGYSYTTFVANDTFYYGVRRVKATRNGNELVVEDEQMLANNFPEAPAKGVRRITTFPLNTQDTVTELQGHWATTKTKKYYSVPGSAMLKRDDDSSQSALIGHLKELNFIATPRLQTTPAKIKTEPNKQKTRMETGAAPAVAANTPIPYQQRQQKMLQTLDVQSDSLVLSFYDNGVVDGDVISVYLNGQPVVDHTLLASTAKKKTVYLNTIKSDEMNLVLVAETLGSLPPNTGLLIVQDGTERHEVHFSADLQTNAAVVLRKRKP